VKIRMWHLALIPNALCLLIAVATLYLVSRTTGFPVTDTGLANGILVFLAVPIFGTLEMLVALNDNKSKAEARLLYDSLYSYLANTHRVMFLCDEDKKYGIVDDKNARKSQTLSTIMDDIIASSGNADNIGTGFVRILLLSSDEAHSIDNELAPFIKEEASP